MSQQTTLKDIATQVGVSTATVSNVLNGRFQRVSRKTIELVHNAVKDSGYQRDVFARGLSTRKSETLGLVVAAIEPPLFAKAISGAEVTAARFGYNIVLCSNRGVEDNEVVSVKSLLNRHVDGIVFISSSAYKQDAGFRMAVAASVPVVVVNRCLDSEHALNVLVANEQGTYDATVHLIDLGHRNIGYIHLPTEGPAASKAAIERHQGFRRALSDYGLDYVPAWVRPGASHLSQAFDVVACSIANDMLSASPRPTAILCGNDYMAVGVLRAAAANGLRVPSDLAVVGHDDTPVASFTTPQLTSIRQPFAQIGVRAVEAAIQCLWKGAPIQGVEHMPCELIVRASSMKSGEAIMCL